MGGAIKPITYLSFNIGSGIDELLMVGIRVIPTGRNGSTVLARTLNYGEPDSGEGIVLQPGERLLFPPGSVKATIQDIERAMGQARHEQQTDALSIFNQIQFVTSGVLRYAGYSLDLRSQVIPALIASRKFIFDVAIERGGRAKTVNVPIDFGVYTP